MQSLTENVHPFRQCRSQLRTMIFDFHSCCFIDHLHCCLSSRAHRIHSVIHHLFILRALIPRTTLLPSYPRNLTRTHLQIHPSAFHPSRRSFHFALSLLLFTLSLTHYFAGIFILCRNPTILRSTSTFAGRFFYQQYSISAYYASAWLGNSRHHVFLGSAGS